MMFVFETLLCFILISGIESSVLSRLEALGVGGMTWLERKKNCVSTGIWGGFCSWWGGRNSPLSGLCKTLPRLSSVTPVQNKTQKYKNVCKWTLCSQIIFINNPHYCLEMCSMIAIINQLTSCESFCIETERPICNVMPLSLTNIPHSLTDVILFTDRTR